MNLSGMISGICATAKKKSARWKEGTILTDMPGLEVILE